MGKNRNKNIKLSFVKLAKSKDGSCKWVPHFSVMEEINLNSNNSKIVFEM